MPINSQIQWFEIERSVKSADHQKEEQQNGLDRTKRTDAFRPIDPFASGSGLGVAPDGPAYSEEVEQDTENAGNNPRHKQFPDRGFG